MSKIIFSTVVPVLALTAFAAGLSEFIIIGLLDSAASALSVPIGEAGLLISIYALGITIGAPVLILLTRRQSGRLLCIIMIATFALLNALFVIASHSWALLALRFLSGIIHGAYFSVASASLASVISARRVPLAIALMFSGLTLAVVGGVPLGMLAAEQYGWQWPFVCISAISGVSALLLLKVLPVSFGITVTTSNEVRLKPTFTLALIQPLCFTILAFGGGFVFFAYVAPWLTFSAGLDTKQVALMMGLAGVGSLAGNIFGGILPDRLGIRLTLCVTLLLQVVGLLGVYLYPAAGLFIWSMGAFATAPIVQSWVVVSSGILPARVSAALNVSAFNLGISFSSFIGSCQISFGGLKYLPVTAAIIVLFALPFCLSGKTHLSVK
ncbi:MFS transporter [Mixta intestinalis]|uniref:Inner membrane transport protein YdhP n=1 Tax=Mixta intestinalis TaxID=1615494 RepID=A0A6P1Q7J3_9GAMM|nr:MFS transporter [Mixta intestinalis]QHM74007.1 Inner membrane transport protein YdhP [Mixta intestinalis]